MSYQKLYRPDNCVNCGNELKDRLLGLRMKTDGWFQYQCTECWRWRDYRRTPIRRKK